MVLWGKTASIITRKPLQNFFSPEFRNRLDSIVNFEMLNKQNSIKVVDKFLMELELMLMDKNISLSVGELKSELLILDLIW